MIARLNVNIKDGWTSFRFSNIAPEANFYRGKGEIVLNIQSPHFRVFSYGMPEYNKHTPDEIYLFGQRKIRDQRKFKDRIILNDFQLIKLYNSMKALNIELYVNRKPFSVGFI